MLAISQLIDSPRSTLAFLEILVEKQVNSDNKFIDNTFLPGTLFFWLYYFQGDGLRKNLFNAILHFIFSSTKGLYAYDAIAPLLHGMQKRSYVSETDKVLVQTFLNARLEEQLKMKSDVFWQTACNLTNLNPADDVFADHFSSLY